MSTQPIFLYAPDLYWKLTQEERESFRCGPGRGVLEKLVPETIWLLKITDACSIHDFMYHEGEASDQGKIEADLVLRNNMIRIIEAKTKSKLLLKLRLRRAQTYYLAVKHLGGPAYWQNKNKPSEMGLIHI